MAKILIFRHKSIYFCIFSIIELSIGTNIIQETLNTLFFLPKLEKLLYIIVLIDSSQQDIFKNILYLTICKYKSIFGENNKFTFIKFTLTTSHF